MRQSVKLVAMGLFVLIAITQLGQGECDQHSNENPKTITLNLWIFHPAPQVIHFAINTVIECELPAGPPITSAFDNNFLEAVFYVVPAGDQCLPSFKIHYSTVTNETEAKVDDAAEEFLSAFNYTDLEILTQYFDNDTCTFTRQYKYLNNSGIVWKNFAKFAPQTDMINDFIDLYTPGNDSMHLTWVGYDVDSEHHWNLTINGSVGDVFTLGEKTVDLRSLLNATGPIAATGGPLTISVNIENRTIGSEKYAIAVKDISQSGYTISSLENDEVTYTWQLNSNESLEDLTIAVELDIYENMNEKTINQTAIIAISVLAVAAVIIIVLIVRKKRRRIS